MLQFSRGSADHHQQALELRADVTMLIREFAFSLASQHWKLGFSLEAQLANKMQVLPSAACQWARQCPAA